jgi:hypothetical protein
MKKIKEMIIPILVSFTLVNSLYGTFKISELENEIGQLQRELEDKIGTSEREELSDRILGFDN